MLPDPQHHTRLQQLEDFFRLSQDMFVVASLDGYFLQMNEAVTRTLGYTQSELKEHPFLHFIHPDDIESTLKEVEKSRQGIRTLYFENRYRCKDGTYRWLAWTNTISENGYVHAVARDITDEKKIEAERIEYREKLEEQVAEATAELEKTNQYLKRIINFAPLILWSVDKEGVITLLEGKALERMNLKPGEQVGTTIFDLFSDKPESIERLGRAMQGEEFSTIIEDNNYALDSHYVPITDDDGDIQGFAGVANNITELMHTQAELKNTLEREIELGKLRSLFVSMASHELRTPLTTILSSTELLENPIERYPIERRAKQYARIKSAVKHMVQLLDDVLFIGKAQHGKLTFTPRIVQLCDLCREIIGDLEDIGQTIHEIVFKEIGRCPPALLDPRLIRQIITNLLSNAVKYSPDGGQIKLQLITKTDYFVLVVQDNGIGIPEADQDQLFTLFYRAKNVGNIKGTGLGLSIVAQAIAMHDGTIKCHSGVGKGTTFTVNIPIKSSIDSL